MTRFLLLATSLVIATSSAHADTDVSTTASSDRSTHSHLAVTAGLATPVGEIGAEYTLVVHPRFELGFAAGVANLIKFNSSAASLSPDLQVAVMPRFRTLVGPGTLTLGAGLSTGHYTVQASPFASRAIAEETYALWVNGEVGYEWCARSGMFVRGSLGLGKVVAHGIVRDGDGQRAMTLTDGSLPYLGLGVGYAF